MGVFFYRLLTGIGIGAVSMAAPLYVAEVAAASRRGPLGTAFQLLVTLGIFLAYSVGSLVSWSWLAVTGASLCFIHAILLLFIPETPRLLLAKHDGQVVLYDSMNYVIGDTCYLTHFGSKLTGCSHCNLAIMPTLLVFSHSADCYVIGFLDTYSTGEYVMRVRVIFLPCNILCKATLICWNY